MRMAEFVDKEKFNKIRGLKKRWYFKNINTVNRKQVK